VNLAARLCGEAKSGQILVDGKVHTAVEALTDFDPVGELELKGFHRPVAAFDIKALRGGPVPPDQIAAEAASPKI
jgi:adenylate cyclase